MAYKKIGVAGPVGSGKTALIEAVTRRMAKDYSIGVAEKPDRRYVMYCEGGQRIVLSPSAELVNALKNVAPRKVFTD